MSVWQRIKGFFRRLFGREVAPGRFEHGAKFAWAGWLAGAPLVWPRREYLLYVPQGWSRWRRAPLIVLCHGCRQTPEDLATATRIAAWADRERWLVLLPRQKAAANPWRCWNWFDRRTAAGAGEAAIVHAQIESVARSHRADPRRVVVVGMSAGGALAAVLGVRAAGLVRAVVVHSGLACGAATTPVAALAAMKHGPAGDVIAPALDARRASPREALPVPLLAIHGEQDGVVAPRNANALVRQYLALNGVEDDPSEGAPSPTPSTETRATIDDGRDVVTRDWRKDGRLVVRQVSVAGLDHAWSGGDASFAYNDPRPPDAMALVAAFLRDAL